MGGIETKQVRGKAKVGIGIGRIQKTHDNGHGKRRHKGENSERTRQRPHKDSREVSNND